VLPILTTAQMREADARAVASRGVDALVTAAGTAVGLEVQRCLGRCYGARVAVVVGPGLNGADGRVAAAWLRGRGAKVDVIAVGDQPATLAGYELVVDAAFGLGCSRPYAAPALAPGTTVVAVDLPSGVDADSGDVLGAPLAADVTVALGAFKYAHLTGDAAALAGAPDLPGSTTQATTDATSYLVSNGFTAGSNGASCPGGACESYSKISVTNDTITVSLQRSLPLDFMPVLNLASKTVTATAKVEASGGSLGQCDTNAGSSACFPYVVWNTYGTGCTVNTTGSIVLFHDNSYAGDTGATSCG